MVLVLVQSRAIMTLNAISWDILRSIFCLVWLGVFGVNLVQLEVEAKSDISYRVL